MGRYSVGLRGESHYQRNIASAGEGELVELWHEDDNPHDPRAIQVRTLAGAVLGYLPKDGFLTKHVLDEGGKVFTRIEAITGGERGKPLRGVIIEVLTGEDGIAAATALAERQPRRSGCLGAVLFALVAAAAVVAAVPVQAAPDASGERIDRTARAHCARLFPKSFSTQLFCMKQNRAGGAKWRALREAASADPALAAAMDHCLDLFTQRDGSINWSTAAFCAQREVDARRELAG